MNFSDPIFLNNQDDSMERTTGDDLSLSWELLGLGVSLLRSKDLENQLRDTTKHFEEFWRGVGCVENRQGLIHVRWKYMETWKPKIDGWSMVR